MKDFPIPVVAQGRPLFGAGSQTDVGEDFSFMPISAEVRPFAMPRVPEAVDLGALAGARDLLADFVAGLEKSMTRALDLSAAPPAVVEVLNQTLGEGEVSIRILRGNGARGEIRIQESVFAGIWRECHLDAAGRSVRDCLLAAPIPAVAAESAESGSTPVIPALDIPAGAMNAPALLNELRAAVAGHKAGELPHVINLTLLPLTPEDHQLLDRAAPVGAVAILSRGFGNCRVTSTAVRNLWRVQYFNSMQTLILNTLEVTRMPEVVLAAPDDLADSRKRLRELLDWMDDDLAAATRRAGQA